MESAKSEVGKKKIIVIGGGFAGLNFAQQMFKNKDYHVTLVDKNNYNYFTPLLYQVATSFLDPSSISYPFRRLLRDKRINFRMAELKKVDPEKQVIYLSDGEMEYDHLVFAAGAETNFYGIESVKKNAISLKGIDDALKMRNALLKTLESATRIADPAERAKALNIVIAGGGPTGVEIAGMLAELKKYVMAKDYPEIAQTPGDIYIVDGAPVLLAPMSDQTHEDTYQTLSGLGVRIKLNAQVTDFSEGKVTFANGDIIEAPTLIWAAGVIANVFDGIPTSSLGAGRRMLTDVYNRVAGVHNIWAIGDISIQKTDDAFPKGHPQQAQVAIQQGRHLAKNFLAIAKGKELKPFKYFDKGEMAIIGRNEAVVDLFKHRLHFKGILALFVWLYIHVVSLVHVHNKVRTLYNWAVAYLTRDQSFRMIFRS